MNVQTRALIDIGSNSIKLTVARVGCSWIETLLDCQSPANVRLGKGFYRHQKLQPHTMRAAVDAVRELLKRASHYEPVSVRAIATSVVRDARNRDEFIALVKEATGLIVEVLSGKCEAEWIFRGATSDPSVGVERLLVLGFGGGSTAAIVGDAGQIHCHSFDLGSVRLMEMLHLGDSPSANDHARCEIYLSQIFTELIRPQINSVLPANAPGDFTLVGTGGVVTSLARMKTYTQHLSSANVQALWLTREEISEMGDQLWRFSPSERRELTGFSKTRCDMILPGVAILEAAIKHLGFKRMRVTRRGVRYGALLDAGLDNLRTFDSIACQKNDAATTSNLVFAES